MVEDPVQALLALAIGFAVAGLVSTAYQALTDRPASFRLLGEAPPAALAAVPLLLFAAPFIIMRNSVRGLLLEQRPLQFVTLATVIAGFWSLMSGSVVVMLLGAII